MITVIRNDCKARFAHDIYGVKIKEELPNYKLIGATRNEGICLYESPNYGAVVKTFDIIVEAIMNGEQSILICPPVVDKKMSKEEFIEKTNVHDFVKDLDKLPVDGYDMFGRKLSPEVFGDCRPVNEQNPPFRPYNETDFYAWNSNESTLPLNPLEKNSFNNKFLNNRYD